MSNSKKVDLWFSDIRNKLTGLIKETAFEAAESGKNITQHHVDTRGTAKSGKRGRVETGRMRDSISSRTTPLSDTEVEAEFGWIKGTPDYAWYQELGFYHRGGNAVEGMYALTDARDEVQQNIREDLVRRLRGL